MMALRKAAPAALVDEGLELVEAVDGVVEAGSDEPLLRGVAGTIGLDIRSKRNPVGVTPAPGYAA